MWRQTTFNPCYTSRKRHVPTDKKYFVYPDCINGRKIFTGLIRGELQRDPACGDVFIFVSRSRQSIKLLFWEHGGFVIYYKKMDNGSFEVPPLRADGQSRHISEIQLLQVIRGIEFQKEKQRSSRRKTTLVLEQ